MRTALSFVASLALLALGTNAQQVSFVSPASGAQVQSGVPFNVTMQVQNSNSQFNVLALMIGSLPVDDPSNSILGGELKVISQPQFQPLGPHGERQIIFPITVSGSGPLTITCGEFFTVGATNGPEVLITTTHVDVV